MDPWVQIGVPIIVALFTSSGLWAVVSKRVEKVDAERKVYVDRGYVTQDEYENLNDYLYMPYEKMGGNGSAKRVMEEVRKLPMRK